jgi:nucleotide-binding universal stress UspA family protein
MSETTGQTLVVGVDFQAGGDEAIVMALRMLASGAARTVHLLHVLDPRDVMSSKDFPALETEEQVLEAAPGILVERASQLGAQQGLAYDGNHVLTHARIGPAVQTLLQMAVDYDADMLLVGTHGRRGIDRLVLGSVAEKLVREAHCPVLVARPKDYAGLARTALPDAPLPAGQRAPQKRGIDPTDHVVSTESDGWDPSHSLPTGMRIV